MIEESILFPIENVTLDNLLKVKLSSHLENYFGKMSYMSQSPSDFQSSQRTLQTVTWPDWSTGFLNLPDWLTWSPDFDTLHLSQILWLWLLWLWNSGFWSLTLITLKIVYSDLDLWILSSGPECSVYLISGSGLVNFALWLSLWIMTIALEFCI